MLGIKSSMLSISYPTEPYSLSSQLLFWKNLEGNTHAQDTNVSQLPV
jgi:hypothetical protein